MLATIASPGVLRAAPHCASVRRIEAVLSFSGGDRLHGAVESERSTTYPGVKTVLSKRCCWLASSSPMVLPSSTSTCPISSSWGRLFYFTILRLQRGE
eukprot:scaffold14090_cov31-Tisochrysis_lutea.AAC.2